MKGKSKDGFTYIYDGALNAGLFLGFSSASEVLGIMSLGKRSPWFCPKEDIVLL